MLIRRTTNQITQTNDGEIVKVAGWVYQVRDIGKIVFVLIQDREGIMQVVFRKDMTDKARDLSLQDVIEIEGGVRVVKPGTIKDKRIAQSFEIIANHITILSKAASPLPKSSARLTPRRRWNRAIALLDGVRSSSS